MQYWCGWYELVTETEFINISGNLLNIGDNLVSNPKQQTFAMKNFIMPKLIFDIETVGEDFDSLDLKTQESLTRWLDKDVLSKEREEKNDASA